MDGEKWSNKDVTYLPQWTLEQVKQTQGLLLDRHTNKKKNTQYANCIGLIPNFSPNLEYHTLWLSYKFHGGLGNWKHKSLLCESVPQNGCWLKFYWKEFKCTHTTAAHFNCWLNSSSLITS